MPNNMLGIGAIPEAKVHIRTSPGFLTHPLLIEKPTGLNQYKKLLQLNNDGLLFTRGIKIKQSGNNTTNQKLLSFEYDEPTTEILKAVNTQTGTTTHLFEANGKMTIHNGTQKILQLDPSGLLHARKIKVDTDTWPDYVFRPNYNLMSLKETEKYIKENGHLPNVPSEKEMLENGVDLVEMNVLLLEKIEELTLHTIKLEKELEQIKSSLSETKKITE